MKDVKGEVYIVIFVLCVVEDNCCEFELKLVGILVRLCFIFKEKNILLFFFIYLILGRVLVVFNYGFCLFLERVSMSEFLGVCKFFFFLVI